MFIVISGLPGTGKSALARMLAERIGAVHLSIDIVEDAMLAAGLEKGLATGVAAYEAVRAAAEQNLALGLSVVVDAVNDSEPARATWRNAAAAVGVPVRFVLLQLEDSVEHRRRLETRDRGLANIAEPSWDEVLHRAARFEPWREGGITVDAGPSISEVADRLLEALAWDL